MIHLSTRIILKNNSLQPVDRASAAGLESVVANPGGAEPGGHTLASLLLGTRRRGAGQAWTASTARQGMNGGSAGRYQLPRKAWKTCDCTQNDTP